jgi:predicted O-methyltransferase YrrM
MTDYPNWFQYSAKTNFEQFLTPLAGQDGLTCLQLGAFTGDASVWLCENILTGAKAYLSDVDTWEGSDEEAHKAMDFKDVYNTYLNKIADYKNKVIIRRTITRSYLLRESNTSEIFDFIYIDADHTTVGVLLDAELSWPLLKVGGIMAFDDYTWGAEMPVELSPTLGIDLFLARHAGKYETLAVNEQVWIRKNDN